MPNDFEMINITSGTNKKWKLSYIVDNAGTKTKTLNTESTFIDRDIDVEITIPAAHFTVENGSVRVTEEGFVNADVIAGSISPATIKSGSATINSASYTYNSTAGNFTVSGSASISGPTVPTAGYVSDVTPAVGTRQTNTATLATTVAKIVGSTSITGSLTYAPSLSKQSVPSGVTDASDGNATTTAPSSGVYIAMRSGAKTGSITATPSVTTAGYGTSTNHGITGTTATVGAAQSSITYLKIKTTSISQGDTTVSGTTASRGIASWSAGWLTSGSISAATFSNTATVNTTYVDISGTTSAPVLISGDYLYINKGYTDNLKISLARLVPDSASLTGNAQYISDQMMNGITAYDKDGILFTGNIQTRGIDDLSVNGKTVSVAHAGYFPVGISKSVADGDYSADSSTSSNSTITPRIDTTNNGSAQNNTYGITTTKPTSGTYFTFAPNMSATTWSVTPRANITTAGYLEIGNKTGTAVTGTPTKATSLTNYYIPVRTISFNNGGGNLSTTSNENEVSNPTVTIGTSGTFFSNASTYNITTTQPSGTDGTNYLTIHETHSISNAGTAISSWAVNRSAITYSNSSGLIAAHTNAEVLAAGNASGTKETEIGVTFTDNFAPRYIPIVTPTFKGGGVTVTATAGATPSTAIATGTTTTETNYYVTATADASGSRAAIQYDGEVKGAISKANNTQALAASGTTNATQKTTRVYLKEAQLDITATNASAIINTQPGTVTIATENASLGNDKTRLEWNPGTDSTNIDKYYLAIKANAAANTASASISGSATASVASVGYAPSSLTKGGVISGTANASIASKDSSIYYIPVPKATLTGSNGNITIATAGYLPEDEVVASMATATGSIGFLYGTTATSSGTKKPEIKKQNTPTGVTNAASGNATTNAPTSGVYVAIKSDANTATLTAKETIASPGGYAAPGEFNTNTISVGATASDMTYVPITTVTPGFNGGTLTTSSDATFSNITTSSTDNGIKIQTRRSASVTDITYSNAVNGWVIATSGAVVKSITGVSNSNGSVYYVTGITVPKDKGFSLTTTADTALDTTSNINITNGAFRNLFITNSGTTTVTSGSKTVGNLTVAAYDSSSATSLNTQSIVTNGVWNTTTVSGTGTFYGKVTIGGGAYSASVDSHTISKPTVTPSIGGNVTDITQTTAPSGTNGTDYWTLDPGGSVTTSGSSKAKAKATIDTAGYLAAGNKTSGESSITLDSSQITIAAGTNRYLLKATNSKTNGTASATANAGTASITTQPSASASTTITPSGIDGGYYTDSTTSNYYIDVSASASSNSGVVTATGGSASASVTASSVTVGIGYNPSAVTVSTSASSTGNKTGNTATTTAATASDSKNSKIYLKASAITTSSTNDGMSTYFNSGTASDKNVTIIPKYTATAGYKPAESTAITGGGTSYWKIKTTTRSAGAGSVTLTAGNGTVTLTRGSGDSGSSSASNLDLKTTAPTSGVYYTLTATGKGTVTGYGSGSVSTGTGWVTSGSTSSNNSSTATKDSNTATTYGYIMKSVNDSVVTGSIPTVPNGALGIEIQPYGYVKIPAGYNPQDRYIYANKANAGGEATAASGYSLAVSNTTGASGSSTVSVGTLADGNYPIIANNLSITATLTASTPGWFSSGSATDSDVDSITVGKMAAAGITYSGGGLTATTNYSATPTITLASNSNTNMTNINLGAQNTTTYPYFFQFKATTAQMTGTTKVTRADYKDTRTAGYLPARSATTVLSSTTCSPTVTVGAASNTSYFINLKQATATVTGTNTVTPSASLSGNTNVTLSTTDTSGIAVTATGGGTASVTATAKTNAPGYSGPATTTLGSATLTATNNTTTATQYITGVTLTAGKTFSITIPNGSATNLMTLVFTVDNDNNVTISD